MAVKTPRGPDGKFACVPTYPRLRTSPCGCGGGGLHPCQIGKRLAPVREAAKRVHRASRPKRPALTDADYDDIVELEGELYGIAAEQDALRSALDWTRTQIRDAGSLKHSARDQGRYGNVSRGRGIAVRDTSESGSSERAYEDLLNERDKLNAHWAHLRSQTASLKMQIRAIKGGTKMRFAGAARAKIMGSHPRVWAARFAAVRPYVTQGPNYSRPIAENWATAIRMHKDGRDWEADHWWVRTNLWLTQAKQRAAIRHSDGQSRSRTTSRAARRAGRR